MNPILSIIIPAKNEEKAIGATLEKFKALSIPHELIVCDDNSTDRTAEIARGIADQVISYGSTEHHTIGAVRNVGAKAARGKYLVFLDANAGPTDLEAFFTKAIQDFERIPRLTTLSPYVRVLPAYETLSDRLIYAVLNAVVRFQNNVLKSGANSLGKFQMTTREAFNQVGGYREDLVATEDVDMCGRLGKVGRPYFDPALTIFHTGRRARQVGWPRLLFIWFANSLSYAVRNKSVSKEWTVIR